MSPSQSPQKMSPDSQRLMNTVISIQPDHMCCCGPPNAQSSSVCWRASFRQSHQRCCFSAFDSSLRHACDDASGKASISTARRCRASGMDIGQAFLYIPLYRPACKKVVHYVFPVHSAILTYSETVSPVCGAYYAQTRHHSTPYDVNGQRNLRGELTTGSAVWAPWAVRIALVSRKPRMM